MAGPEAVSSPSAELRERLNLLEKTYRATLNMLEDFDEEKHKLAQVQQATMNLLEDFNEERGRFREIQTATLNLLEDFNEERTRLSRTQGALMNILDDVEAERVKAEAERVKADQAKTLLEAVNKELEAFSYSVSHDLRAPLRAISGFAQALIEDCGPQLNDAGKRYLRLIQSNTHKMGQLIDDLLTFSRLGRQQMMHTGIDMERLARTVIADLAAQTSHRNIKFAVGPVPPARGDQAMIRQVLANLLGNAIKFTATRSEAVIELGYQQEPAPGAYYVRDNGVGFDMQYVGKLFGVFQRMHAATEFEGTGVGLALVYRIISRHGGRTWAQGQVDQGATFYFTLPEGVAT